MMLNRAGGMKLNSFSKISASSTVLLILLTLGATTYPATGQYTETLLNPSLPAGNENFGFSLDVDGDTLVGGAPDNEENGNRAGAAYIFRKSGGTWSEEAKLFPSDPGVFDLFGSDVAISGNTVVIGSPHKDIFGDDFGAVYVFQRSGTTWSEQAILVQSDPEHQDLFGWSVDIDGDTIAVGAPASDDAPDCVSYPNPQHCNSGVWVPKIRCP